MRRDDDSALYLVSCVSKKRQRPTAGRDLYLSVWFQKARAFVEAQGAPWYILSAKYGLVRPDEVIAPYELTLNRMPIQQRRLWAQRVAEQLERERIHAQRAVVLAGLRYREFLMPALAEIADSVEVPMEGLGIGQQLAWLGKQR